MTPTGTAGPSTARGLPSVPEARSTAYRVGWRTSEALISVSVAHIANSRGPTGTGAHCVPPGNEVVQVTSPLCASRASKRELEASTVTTAEPITAASWVRPVTAVDWAPDGTDHSSRPLSASRATTSVEGSCGAS